MFLAEFFYDLTVKGGASMTSLESSAVSSPSIMEALRQFSGFCGISLQFAVDLADDLKRLVAEKAYAELHIEIKAGRVFRCGLMETKQYSDTAL